MLIKLLAAFLTDARQWAIGKSWIWRTPILAYLGYAGVRHLFDPHYGSLFGGITFGIHELGHVIFGFLGQWLSIAGGSLAQIAAPVVAAFMLLRQRDYFGVAVGGSWIGFSLFNVATYIEDARSRQIPLLGLTADPIHDWNYLLSSVGLLAIDGFLAFLTRVLAFSVWGGSIALGAWLCWLMAVRRR